MPSLMPLYAAAACRLLHARHYAAKTLLRHFVAATNASRRLIIFRLIIFARIQRYRLPTRTPPDLPSAATPSTPFSPLQCRCHAFRAIY